MIELDTYPAMLESDYNHHFEIDPDGTARNTIDPDPTSHGVYVCKMPRVHVEALVEAFVAAGFDDLARAPDPDDWCFPFVDRGFDGMLCRPRTWWRTDVGGITLTFRHGDRLVRVNDEGNHSYRHAAELRAAVEAAIEDDSCR